MSIRKMRKKRGFTLIEVMISIGIMTVGSLGVMAAFKSAIHGNSLGRQRAIATEVTRTWVDRMKRDALNWNQKTVGGVITTRNLKRLPAAGQSSWFQPMGVIAEQTFPAADWLGQDTNVNERMKYCTLIQLTWIEPGASARADIRTWWQSNSSNGANLSQYQGCAAGDIPAVINDLNLMQNGLHEVASSIVLRWQPMQVTP